MYVGNHSAGNTSSVPLFPSARYNIDPASAILIQLDVFCTKLFGVLPEDEPVIFETFRVFYIDGSVHHNIL